jgi:hypothetical protein
MQCNAGDWYTQFMSKPVSPTVTPTPSISWPAVSKVELVIRLMPAIYSRLPVEIVDGPPDGDITFKAVRISFPDPLNLDGTITDALFEWLVEKVKEASARFQRRMSIVAGDLAVYVEVDGRVIA